MLFYRAPPPPPPRVMLTGSTRGAGPSGFVTPASGGDADQRACGVLAGWWLWRRLNAPPPAAELPDLTYLRSSVTGSSTSSFLAEPRRGRT